MSLLIEVGKSYKSRDGRIWRCVSRYQNGSWCFDLGQLGQYRGEESDSGRGTNIYPFLIICESTKTWNNCNEYGIASKTDALKNLIEEVDEKFIGIVMIDDVPVVVPLKRVGDSYEALGKYAYESKTSAQKGKIFDKGQLLQSIISYEDYCRMSKCEPRLTKPLTRDEKFQEFLKDEKNFAFLGCQKENHQQILQSFFDFYKLISGQKMKVDFFAETLLKIGSDENIDVDKFNINDEEKRKLAPFFTSFRNILNSVD